MYEGITKENTLVIDTETNALWNPDEIHVICTRNSKDETFEFRQPLQNPREKERLFEHLGEYSFHCGHNFISYDLLRVFDRLLPGHPIRLESCIDTLVISRLINYNRKGGHSLASFGEEFGVKKEGQEIEQWDTLTERMVERCHSDTKINTIALDRFWRFIGSTDWERSLRLEHWTAYATGVMSLNGFAFDKERALRLQEKVHEAYDPMDKALLEAFPPRPVLVREIQPRITKHGTFNLNDFRWYDGNDLSIFTGGPFSLIRYEEFNPGSVQQIIDRLDEAGWRPTDKTKGHIDFLKDRSKDKDPDGTRRARYEKYGWKISEENLATVPDTAPEATKNIGRRIVLSSRLSDLEEWLNIVKPDHIDSGGVAAYGDFNPIGAWTHRLSHARPNLANVPVARRSPKDTEWDTFVNDINDEMRGLWKARKGFRLVGTDADGLQMRIFAHYVNDKELIDALIRGTKEDKTDIHSVHQRKLGDPCKSRDSAKTFIYAWLLGAGNAKVAEILETTASAARDAVSAFIESYPGLKELKTGQIPADAKRGFFVGLDGRKVICNNEHLMLAGYLQNGEAIIMKGACREWQEVLTREKIPFRMVTWPHDEWQTEIPDDDDICRYVQEVQIQAIRNQSEILEMNCPLDGSSDWGYTWKETH